ncbi:MAG: DUF4249 domain-containing protein [Muribaculaceae bacterium]|nr:DUF4249 domain-containing protein [Muribaculaceae bacterium]
MKKSFSGFILHGLSILLPLLYLLFIPGSCGSDQPGAPRTAVIEGFFNSDGYPTVLFSSSISPSEEGSLRDALINWGRVTISDGRREVVLTGMADTRYLPPFRYTTTEMRGEPGKTYTVKADFRELSATASCRMPFPTPIDSLTFEAADADTLRATTLHFTSPADTPAFYYLSMRPQNTNTRESICMMGTIKAERPGEHYSIAVLRPRVKIDSVTYLSQLIVGEKWTVSLNRVEKEVYEFWKSYDNMVLFSSSPFLNSSESLPSNIRGGYGIWSPQGTSSLDFSVE